MSTVEKPKSKRALLIGINKYLNSNFRDLDGCINDVQIMFKLLTETFQFPPENISVLHDDCAEKPTREGILCAFDRLVSETCNNDIVVFFYAGHGSRRKNSIKASGYNETIVPRDSGRTGGRNTSEQYNTNLDITDDELQDLMLRPLTLKTSNLVLIFDSCHSGHILREVDFAKARFVEADESEDSLNETVNTQSKLVAVSRTCVSEKGASGWFPQSNKYVLLAACQAHEKANEKHVTYKDGKNTEVLIHGAWTYELCRAILAEAQAETSTYRSVFERAFPLVTESFPAQHPIIEGVLNHAVFDIHTVPTIPYAIVIGKRGKQVQLSYGAVHGFSLGSQFVICTKGTKIKPESNDPAVISSVTITEVGAVRSWADSFETDAELDKVNIGSPAFEVAHAFNELKVGVRVVISSTLQEWIKAQSSLELENLNNCFSEVIDFVGKNAYLFFVKSDDTSFDCITVQLSSPNQDSQTVLQPFRPLYFVYGADGQLEIEKPLEVNSDGTAQLRSKLELLGKYHRLLRLHNSNDQSNPLHNKVEMQLLRRFTDNDPWCDVSVDKLSLLPIILEDQYVGVRIVNKSTMPIEVGLLEFAENGSVNVLYPPNGVSETIEQGCTLCVGEEWGAIEVASSLWFQETFKLFITIEKTDFAILEQGPFRGNVKSSLNELLTVNKMRLVRKQDHKKSYWTTVQKTFEIKKKTQSIVPGKPSFSSSIKFELQNANFEFAKTFQENFDKLSTHYAASVEHVFSKSALNSLESFYKLFQSFKFECTEADNMSHLNNFYEEINWEVMHNTITNLDYEALLNYFLSVLLHEKENILPAYKMIRAIWIEDYTAEKNECKEFQIQFSKTGFSALVNHIDALTHPGEYPTIHYNLGLILSRNCDAISARDAIDHYNLALNIWNNEEYPVDHGQTLFAIANVYSHLMELTETINEKLKNARSSIALLKKAYKVFKAAESNEAYAVINNLTIVLSQIAEIDPDEKFSEDFHFASTLIENTISIIKSQPLRKDTAEILIEMLMVKSHLLKCDIALPWQEDIIETCNELLRSNVLNSKCRMQCNNMLGNAFSLRLVGSKGENLQQAVEHFLAVTEFFSTRDLNNKQFATCVVNLGAAVNELRYLNISPETNVYKEKAKKLLMYVVTDSKMLNDKLKIAARYNLSLFMDDNFEELQSLLPIAAKHAPNVCGQIYADIAIKLLSRSFQDKNPFFNEHLFSTETINFEECSTGDITSQLLMWPSKGFATARFEEFICLGGNLCGHTEKVLSYLQEAEKLLVIERDKNMSYFKNLGVMGAYWATHCTLPYEEKIKRSLCSFRKAIENVERLWPMYNVDAQVTLVNETGFLWEDALDVAIEEYFLQTEQHAQSFSSLHILDILCSAKCRNLLTPLQKMKSSSNRKEVLQACTLPSSASLSAVKTIRAVLTLHLNESPFMGSSFNVIQNLQEEEVAVEWWISNKQFILCIVYSKIKNVQIYRKWHRVESENLYKLCLAAQSNPNFMSWNQTFIYDFSQALYLEELYKHLVKHFPTATKLFLLPHAYLYCCPIHGLSIFKDKSFCLLDVYPGGVSYLPNLKMLEILRQPNSDKALSETHTFLFQADPNHDLPYSIQEVINIETIVKAAQKTCSLSVNTTTETFIKTLPLMTLNEHCNNSSCSAPFFLHIACHGNYNEEEPAESYLLFDDSKFTMTQFENLSLTFCQLAVLSACNSGMRDFSRTHMTDIYIGFGAQLLAKGCKNVLLALSPVADQSTAELMNYFYQGIFNEKKSIASSLRDAQLKLRDNATLKFEVSDEGLKRLVGKKTNLTKATKYNDWLFAPFVLLGDGNFKFLCDS